MNKQELLYRLEVARDDDVRVMGIRGNGKLPKEHVIYNSIIELIKDNLDDPTVLQDVKEPPYYNKYPPHLQPIHVLRSWFTDEQWSACMKFNVTKYIARYKDKGGIQDLKKAKTYMEWERMQRPFEKENSHEVAKAWFFDYYDDQDMFIDLQVLLLIAQNKDSHYTQCSTEVIDRLIESEEQRCQT